MTSLSVDSPVTNPFTAMYESFLGTLTPPPPAETLVSGPTNPDSVTQLFIHHFQQLITPLFLKQRMISSGQVIEALTATPQGIWYSGDYADALLKAGDAVMTIKGTEVKANELYQQMKEAGQFLQAISGPSDYWESVPDLTSVTRVKNNVTVMKAGCSPSAAFEALKEGLSFFECKSIRVLAGFFVLKTIWGDELFDRVIGSLPKLRIGTADQESTLMKNMLVSIDRVISRTTLAPSLKPGICVSVAGVNSYTKKHRHGVWQGFNLITLGGELVTGFGVDPRGISLKEVKTTLLTAYNNPPSPLTKEASAAHLELEFSSMKIDSPSGKKNISIREFRSMVLPIKGALPPDLSTHIETTLARALTIQQEGEEELKRFAEHTVTAAEFEEMSIDTPCYIFNFRMIVPKYFLTSKG